MFGQLVYKHNNWSSPGQAVKFGKNQKSGIRNIKNAGFWKAPRNHEDCRQ